MTLKEQILSAKDISYKKVFVPEWGCDVWLKTLSSGERLQVTNFHKNPSINPTVAGVVLCCCDENGNKIFTDADADALSKKSGEVMEKLGQAIVEHNAFDKLDEAKKS